jgi:hypothetical protein
MGSHVIALLYLAVPLAGGRLGALALGGFGNGLALVHDASSSRGAPRIPLRPIVRDPEDVRRARVRRLRPHLDAMIAGCGVRPAFLLCGFNLTLVGLPPSAAWPRPDARRRASLERRGEIAQLVEHTTENRGVPGSSPGLAIVPAALRWWPVSPEPAPSRDALESQARRLLERARERTGPRWSAWSRRLVSFSPAAR